MKLCTKYGPRVESLVGPGCVPYFLTLTVRDGSDLLERCGHFMRLWKVLTYRRRTARASQATALRGMLGGVLSIEVTKGKGSGLWHPHGHCLLLAPDRIEGLYQDDRGAWRWPALSQEVMEITQDSFIVECHPVEAVALHQDDDAAALLDVLDNSGQADALPVSPGLRRAVAECLKYPLKASSMLPVDIVTAWSVLRTRRLIRSFGSLYGFGDEPGGDDQLAPDADGSFIDWFYRWASGRYSLVGTRIGGSHV